MCLREVEVPCLPMYNSSVFFLMKLTLEYSMCEIPLLSYFCTRHKKPLQVALEKTTVIENNISVLFFENFKETLPNVCSGD